MSTLTQKELIKYVLNENNKEINEKIVEKILKKYGVKHKVKDIKTFKTAMVHSSYVERDLTSDRIVKMISEKDLTPIEDKNIKKALPLQEESYERLEFLGDSVIHMIIAEYLYERYPDEYEGFMTRLRTKIENGATLAQLSRIMGLHEYAIIARNIEQGGGRDKNIHVFEDILEAFVGALFLDTERDYKICKTFVVNLVEKEVDISQLLFVETNHKDTLLQYFHKQKWPNPDYGLDELIDLADGKRLFRMYVKGYIKHDKKSELVWDIIGIGTGASKKKGEQEAAYSALVRLGVISPDAESDDEYYDEECEEAEEEDEEDDLTY